MRERKPPYVHYLVSTELTRGDRVSDIIKIALVENETLENTSGFVMKTKTIIVSNE